MHPFTLLMDGSVGFFFFLLFIFSAGWDGSYLKGEKSRNLSLQVLSFCEAWIPSLSLTMQEILAQLDCFIVLLCG